MKYTQRFLHNEQCAPRENTSVEPYSWLGEGHSSHSSPHLDFQIPLRGTHELQGQGFKEVDSEGQRAERGQENNSESL